jgi:hypothetical protein
LKTALSTRFQIFLGIFDYEFLHASGQRGKTTFTPAPHRICDGSGSRTTSRVPEASLGPGLRRRPLLSYQRGNAKAEVLRKPENFEAFLRIKREAGICRQMRIIA